MLLWLGLYTVCAHKNESNQKSNVSMRYSLKTNFCVLFSVFAGCQIPYPKREFLTEEEPEDKADKVRNVCFFSFFIHSYVCVFMFRLNCKHSRSIASSKVTTLNSAYKI